jgi:hypothetical protein
VPFKPDEPVPESKNLAECYCPCRHYYRMFHSRQLV